MTWKLALMSVKKRWQDYVVLLAGLVIAVATFYLFQTLSLNTVFLQEVIPTIALVGIIFQLGAVLLGMITIVYIFYANSFLLAMRKKEYGMYLMLGAKKKKIKQMMRIETFVIGLFSLVTGIVLGIGLAKVMTQALMQRLAIASGQYQAFSGMAILVTAAFFGLLFLITSFFNGRKFSKTKLFTLLQEESSSENIQKNTILTFGLTLIALVLFAIGYYSLGNLMTLGITGLVIALFTITFGTFLFFGAVFPFAVNFLKNRHFFANKGLRMFTLSQLSFKAHALSRVLGMVGMLFALSLGAITVGNAFNHYKEALLKQFPYDVVLHNPSAEVKPLLEKLEVEQEQTYHIKVVENDFYFLAEELQDQPLWVQEGDFFLESQLKPYQKMKAGETYSYEREDAFAVMQGFHLLDDPYASYVPGATYHVVDQATFQQQAGEEQNIVTYQVQDFKQAMPVLKAIDQIAGKDQPDPEALNSKMAMYTMIDGMVSGFVFMGIFLGIAFLAMLASCLMFKVLSGAYQDIERYQMLHKLGVKKTALTRSLAQEIFMVFLIPGILGMIHVLFGLKMFELLIPQPYEQIWLPFLLYSSFYFLYYGLTVWLYRKIVLPKNA
ncbi:FtsX-like permease family protein [Enterococcus sp. LJL98]